MPERAARLSTPAPPPIDGPSTLSGWLLRAVDGPEHAGLRFLDRREAATFLPWSQVADRAARAAGTLAAKGVMPGDRVAIVLPTTPAFADAFFGCQLLGAVPVCLYPPARLGRLDEYHRATSTMLRVADARLLITEPRIHRLLGQTLARTSPPLGVVAASTLVEGAPQPPQPIDADDLAMVQFSSGTTVDPKPVGLTHRQVLAQTFALLHAIRATGPDATRAGVSWLPLYHDMGLIGCVFPALCLPGPLTLIPPELFLARPAVWLRTLSRYRGTVSPAPDFAYNLCVERVRDDEIEGVDLSAWSMALDGAEPVRASTVHAFAERFAPHGFDARALSPVYGLSEAALAVTFSAIAEPFTSICCDRAALAAGRVERAERGEGLEIVSVGTPVAGFDVEVRSPDGRALPPRQIGRIWARGPSIMAGYLDRSEQPIRDGWLDTGDLGFVHEGQLYIAGRAKDVLIVRGRNHAPHTLEGAVDGVEGVRTGCAVAVSRVDEAGEAVVLFVECRARHAEQADACRAAVLAATGVQVDEIVLLDPGTLPRTSSGKLRRAETLRRYRDGTLAPPHALTAWHLAGAFAKSAAGRLGWVLD